LKAIFDDLGRKGDPVSSGAVMRYSEALKLEKAKAHVPVTQATPLF
jgi:hypothetical protein